MKTVAKMENQKESNLTTMCELRVVNSLDSLKYIPKSSKDHTLQITSA